VVQAPSRPTLPASGPTKSALRRGSATPASRPLSESGAVHEADRPRVIEWRGRDLIGQPLLNKGTAFSEAERDGLGLRGLLPAQVSTIEQQVALELEHLRRKEDDLERYIGLAALQDRNETLFYRVLLENLEEFLPIVYTPTVGRACQQFSHIFRRGRGIWITPADSDRFDDILRGAAGSTPLDHVRLIVVTDNERILGLGDQGAGGIGIPIGKLALYSVAAGIYPAATLPISLDVGTDNETLLNDPLYLGYRAPRLRGEAYEAMIESFVASVQRVFPDAVLQWEDFKQHNALRILDRYRHRLATFNDDVQGTGAVVLAGLLAARGGAGFADDRFLLVGAGAAGIGIARLLRRQLAAERVWSEDEAPRIALMSSRGLLHHERVDIADDQRPYTVDPEFFRAQGLSEDDLHDPLAVARAMRATVLIGTTGTPGTFGQALIEEVARHSSAPIVLPLSNPGDKAEAKADDIIRWTSGRALVATGSPTGDVDFDGRHLTIGQANNVFIFPGVGLGALVASTREVTAEAFMVAAHELATLVSAERLAAGSLYPPISDLRVAARAVAIRVVRELRDSGYGRQLRDEDIEPAVDAAMWYPEYVPYITE
jgi:malate dehydrogenase (oxaloacetate-decarboxylating)